MDLPVSEPDAGVLEYAAEIGKALETLEDPVVVGHSMSGLMIPLVAERDPIKKLT